MMTKEEILARIDELDAEAIELKAEQESINHLLSLVNSDCSSRMDEILHEAARRSALLHLRVTKWQYAVSEIEREAKKLAA